MKSAGRAAVIAAAFLLVGTTLAKAEDFRFICNPAPGRTITYVLYDSPRSGKNIAFDLCGYRTYINSSEQKMIPGDCYGRPASLLTSGGRHLCSF